MTDALAKRAADPRSVLTATADHSEGVTACKRCRAGW